MAEVDDNVNVDDNQDGKVPDVVVEYTAVQQEAVDRGWTPKDDFKGDPEKWVDAGAYITNGELMDKISQQSNLLKNQGKAIDSFKKLQKGMEKRALEEAKDQLLADKASAYNDGDGAAIVNIEEQIKVTDKEIAAAAVADTPVDHGGAFQEFFTSQWQPDNKWYKTNDVMEAYADKIGVAEFNRDPSVNPADIMAVVDKKIREKFPLEFENPNRQRAGSVGGTNNGKSGGSASNALVSGLTATERKVGLDLVKMKVFDSLKDYAKANADANAAEQE